MHTILPPSVSCGTVLQTASHYEIIGSKFPFSKMIFYKRYQKIGYRSRGVISFYCKMNVLSILLLLSLVPFFLWITLVSGVERV